MSLTQRWMLGIGLLVSLATIPFSTAEDPKPAANKPKELKSTAHLDGLSNWATSVAFSPDSQTLAVGTHNSVQLWNIAAKQATGVWKTGNGYVRSLAFLPGGKQLVVGAYQSASVWNVASGAKERDLPKHRGFVTSLAVSPDGKLLATGCDDESARLIRIEDGALLKTFEHDRDPVQSVAFSADGKLLATAAGDETRVTRPGIAKLWDIESGKLLRDFEGMAKAATSVAFAEKGTRLIVGSMDEKAYVFEIETGKPLGFFGGHGRPVTSIAMSLDNQIAITGSGGRAKGKNELKLWRIADGEVLGTAEEHEAKIAALALSPDGKTVATASYDNSVRLWDVSFVNATSTPAAPVVVAAVDNAANDATVQNAVAAEPKSLKAGIIGLDTSHVIAFTNTLNAETPKPEAVGCRIVAAYPKGSPDIESSTKRVPEYTETVKKKGVEIVDSIEELVKRVDVVFLETNDGRPHYEQILPVLKAGKPCFIDKPIAGSLTDAVAIFEAAKKYKVPVFSSSSLRFAKNTQAARAGAFGTINRCETSSPASLDPTHPDLFWYGIHGVESLFTVMGTGCVSVKRGKTADGKIEVVGQWSEGRVGIFREGGYTGKAIGDKGEGPVGSSDGYDPMLYEILKFFRSGKPPVSEAETLEIYAFMEAADESKRQNGASVTLESVMKKARAEAEEKLKALK
ncbi:MAG: Gfo/Idh/MocA family oxidoreductase [Planctomycetaceae bacterium]